MRSRFNNNADFKAFYIKETPTQMFLVDIKKTFKNIIIYRTPPVAASDSPTTVK